MEPDPPSPPAPPRPHTDGPPPVGVIMLATRFPRLPGDIGHPDTFDGRVVYRRVAAARVGAVVRAEGPADPLTDALVAAARELEAEGAGLIATSCGFLGVVQHTLRAAVAVPVLASALLLLPLLRAAHGPTARIGVLTFDSRALSPAHFDTAWDPDVLIEGMEQSRAFYPAIREDRPTLDAAAAEAEAALAARRLRARAGGHLDAVLLECTNLAPFAARIRQEAGAPVHDLATTVKWMATRLW